MIQNSSEFVKFIRKYLKTKLIYNTDGFKNHDTEKQQVYNLLQRTIEKGESNSALIIGPQGCGKTTLVKDVLKTLESELDLISNAIIIHLNGFIHTDDNLALKSTASQMNISQDLDGKIFGTFAENLAFLLTCLRTGQRSTSKSLIFILEEFDLFCNHSNQTLLYNLLDMTHNSQIPICVIGITCRLDVTELFEKRVKSRFSHRQIFIFPTYTCDKDSGFESWRQRIYDLLSFNETLSKENKKHKTDINIWNKHIEDLTKDKNILSIFEEMYYSTVEEKQLKNVLLSVICKLEDKENFEQGIVIKDKFTADDFIQECKNFLKDDIVPIFQDMSVLEICLLIAMKHHSEIYDGNPFNFEMILTRYNKFSNANTLTHTAPRTVVMKAFEHIAFLELIAPIGNTTSRLQKEYQLYKLLFLPVQISEALKNHSGLPTEVRQWASSSIA